MISVLISETPHFETESESAVLVCGKDDYHADIWQIYDVECGSKLGKREIPVKI